jgi:hypothetical protein
LCPPILVGTVADPTIAQDQSFFPLRPAAAQASDGAYMKLLSRAYASFLTPDT